MKQKSLFEILLRVLLISYAVTAVLLFLTAYFLYAFRLSAGSVTVAVHAIYVISCLIGGSCLGRSGRGRRLFLGLLQGVIYVSVLWLVSVLIRRGITTSFLHTLFVYALCSMSGIVGAVMS